jgi:hypothetical protein
MRRTALLLALLAGVAVPASGSPPTRPPAADKPRVKLAVLVVIDQLRGDFLEKWKPLFGPDGFARLQSEGAWFTNCHYPYATTTTGPGHASMLTGTCPDRHGIVNNNWYDRAAAADVYCAASTRYRLVPPVPKAAEEEPKEGATTAPRPKTGGNPERLLSETVADVLKQTYGAKAKVFGLSLKDRSAILPTGRRPDGAFWFVGRFVTSDYYTERVPDWVEAFNESKAADRWFGKDWTRFRPDLDYAQHSGPDNAAGEGRGQSQGRVFPHPTGAKTGINKTYYDALATSPFGNELLLEFTRACVTAEGLGTDDVPDLLVVSFSSNDLVGHAWGPDSQEVLDVTLRSDAMMADLLKFLDDRVGKGNYVLALTADHGICPLPEASAAKGTEARRVDMRPVLAAAEKHLQAMFGAPAQPEAKEKAKSAWIEATSAPWLYLNRRVAAAAGKAEAEVARALADFLAKQDGVYRTFTREELAGELPATDVIGRQVKRSFHPDRSGDVYVLLKPYHLPGRPIDTGTTHGSPFEYDTHVPLLVYGPGVPGGARSERVTPQATAAILARFLDIRPPKDADFPVPETLENK